MKITSHSKSVIYFRPSDAKVVGKGSFYMDYITWLNAENIELGENVAFNNNCYINGFGGLNIGDRTGLGPGVMIHTANHATDPNMPIVEQGWESRPVTIGKDCFIGMGVIILPGVTIGDDVVIGAGSVVNKNIPSWSIAVGNPCKVIRDRKDPRKLKK